MKLSDLNPILGHTDMFGHELTIDCPICKERFSVHVNYQGPYKGDNIWGLSHPAAEFTWDSVTLTPSINHHPQARNKPKCAAHFSIINGKIV